MVAATTSSTAAGPTTPWPAAPGTTHLQAVDHVELPPYSPDLPGLSGPVLVRHVMTLHLPTGSVLAAFHAG